MQAAEDTNTRAAARPPHPLVQRLRGIYVIPVNDGGGLLNGEDTFTRTFETSPICHEAAAEIERLNKELANIAEAKPSTWDHPEDFQAWAQNRARHALSQNIFIKSLL